MKQKKKSMIADVLPQETIASKIFLLRDKKVMLDRDLAILYEVETRVLNQAVRRNIERFPEDFMFQLTKEEMKNWTSQIVITNKEKMGLRRRPYAFTEPGVAILSSVLNSNRAVHVNIQIIRTFIKLRQLFLTHVELKRKIEDMEGKYDQQFKVVFEVIKKLLEPPKPEPMKRITGFSTKRD